MKVFDGIKVLVLSAGEKYRDDIPNDFSIVLEPFPNEVNMFLVVKDLFGFYTNHPKCSNGSPYVVLNENPQLEDERNRDRLNRLDKLVDDGVTHRMLNPKNV